MLFQCWLFWSPQIFKSRVLPKSEAFMEVKSKGKTTKVTQYLRSPLWHNLAAALVRTFTKKYDLHLVCLHAHHAFKKADSGVSVSPYRFF